MARPFIRKTGFWADGINGLLLRKPYRTYTKNTASPKLPPQKEPATPNPVPQQTQESTSPASSFAEQVKQAAQSVITEASGVPVVATDTKTSATDLPNVARSLARSSQQGQEGLIKQLRNQWEVDSFKQAQEVAQAAITGTANAFAQTERLRTPGTSPALDAALDSLTQSLSASVRSILTEYVHQPTSGKPTVIDHSSRVMPVNPVANAYDVSPTTPLAGFPEKLWRRTRNTAVSADLTVALEALPEYISGAIRPNELFTVPRLNTLGFDDTDAQILISTFEGNEWHDIATPLKTSTEHVQEVLDRAYTLLGVSSPQGVHDAVCWLAAKEAEAIARAVRQKFEKDIVGSQKDGDGVIDSATTTKEHRSRAGQASESESKGRSQRRSE